MKDSFKSGLDMIYLISCSLNGIIPDKKIIDNIDIEKTYDQAKRHNLLSITAMALEAYYGDIPDQEIIKKWCASINKAIKSCYLYSIEREKLYRYMEENKIAYLPLKGIVLQDIYPKIGMRQMGDNDILIDINKRHLVREYMENNGYKVDMYGKAIHDVYLKPPMFNFEIHVYLITEGINPVIYNYYLDIWDRLERCDNLKYEHRFSKEDFYIHILVHAYKHFSHTGVGIKPLSDIFVYLRKYGNSFDRHYLDTELEKIKLTAFERNIRVLSEKLFDIDATINNSVESSLDDEEKELLKFFIDSGSFGRTDVFFKNMIDRFANGDGQITRSGKLKYFLNRLFPTGVYIRENYPFFYKYKVLIPVFWVYRFFSKIFVKFKQIRKEIKFIGKQK